MHSGALRCPFCEFSENSGRDISYYDWSLIHDHKYVVIYLKCNPDMNEHGHDLIYSSNDL